MNTNTNAPKSATADREIVISRIIDAPRELVFKAWTQKEHVDQWWGPDGFRNETHSLDLRVNGEWIYTMHGPDGKDYENLVTYLEINEPAKLVYWHGEPEKPKQFYVTVEFNDKDGKTELIMTNLFESVEAKEFVIREVGAIEGGNQTLNSLANYVLKM